MDRRFFIFLALTFAILMATAQLVLWWRGPQPKQAAKPPAKADANAPQGGAQTVNPPDHVLEGEDTDDVVVVIGGAVGLWTGVNADTCIGKLSIWTKANGLKEAAAQSPIYEVDASNDGARVAFVRQMGADLQLVTAPSTLAGQPTVVQDALGDGSQANPCPAFYTFVAQNLFTSTCTGAAVAATTGRSTGGGSVPVQTRSRSQSGAVAMSSPSPASHWYSVPDGWMDGGATI